MKGLVSVLFLTLYLLSSCAAGHNPTYIISDKVEEEQVKASPSLNEAR